MMKENKVLKLNAKPHTKFGITSLVFVVLSLVLGLIAIYLSSSLDEMQRSDLIQIGVYEWLSFMFNLIGISFGAIAEFRVDRERIFAHIALSLHGILFLFHLVVVWVGFLQ